MFERIQELGSPNPLCMSKAKPVRWTIRQVKFLNGEGGCMTKLELPCLGGWTYHQCFKGDPFFHRFDSSTWSVTHVATSRSVAYCISQSDAVRCVTYLARNWPWQHRDLPQNKAQTQTILLELKSARERGELLFYLGSEDRQTLERIQEDQWERELIAALG